MPAVRGDSQRIFPLCQYLPSPFDAGTQRYQMSPEEAGNIKMNQRHGVLKPYLDSLTEALIKRVKRGKKGRKYTAGRGLHSQLRVLCRLAIIT